MSEEEVNRFLEVSKLIHEQENKSSGRSLVVKKGQVKDLTDTIAQLEAHYKKATEKVAKEKADVDRMKEPSTRDFFKDQKSFDDKMSVEMEEYLEAVSEQEISKKQLDGVKQQKKLLEQEAAENGKQVESLMKLYDEQDAILGKIFNGAYGSDLENTLEAEFDSLLEKKERISIARYKWCNAKILLQHAIKQLGTACSKWQSIKQVPATNCQGKYYVASEARNNLIAASQNVTSAQRYLNNIKFPYCEPGEIQTLDRACQNIFIDMQSDQRHNHAYHCFYVTYRRAAALMQWFDSVINNTIAKDLEQAKKELSQKEKDLRQERLRLIKEKIGSKADNLVLGEEDFGDEDDDLDAELMAVCKPDQTEDSGNSLQVQQDDSMKAPTPLPLCELAPAPSNDELFGNIEQLKQQHDQEMEEFRKAQETNKARLEQGLQEKLAARRRRRTRLTMEN